MKRTASVALLAMLAGTSMVLAQGQESNGNATNSGSPTMKNSPTMSSGAPNTSGAAGGGSTAERPNDPKNDNRVGDVNRKTAPEAAQKGDRTGGN